MQSVWPSTVRMEKAKSACRSPQDSHDIPKAACTSLSDKCKEAVCLLRLSCIASWLPGELRLAHMHLALAGMHFNRYYYYHFMVTWLLH